MTRISVILLLSLIFTESIIAANVTSWVGLPAGGICSKKAIWNQTVKRAPVASNSATIVSALATQVAERYGGVAAFNVWEYGSTIYTVEPNQQRVNVKFHDCQNKGYIPTELVNVHFANVPVPDNAIPNAGADGALSIWSPSSDTLWDFWKARRVNNQWEACWGGKLTNVSNSYGHFPSYYGTAATSLASELGCVTLSDMKSGSIEHALAIIIPVPAPRTLFSWPAQRSDGDDSSQSPIQEGQRFRLAANVNVTSLKLHPIAAMVARAAQKYGLIVSDRGGAVAFTAESGAPEQKFTGINPWNKYLNGTPVYSIFKNFPWNRLEALPLDYGKPGTPVADEDAVCCTVTGPIAAKYNNFTTILGAPTTNELTTSDGIGRYNHFERGSIYWSRSTDAHVVMGGIKARWVSLGSEQGYHGYPITDETPTSDKVGRYNNFEHGSIYWSSATGAHEVRGSIRQNWINLGGEGGSLGYPISDEYDVSEGRRSDFQRGSLIWNRTTYLVLLLG